MTIFVTLETSSATECGGVVEVSGLVVVAIVVSGEGGDVFSAEALTVVVCGGTAVVAAVGAPVVSAVWLSDNEPGELAEEGACVVVGVGVVLPSRTAVVAVVGEATSPAAVLALTSAGEVLLSADTLVDPSASPSASNARRVR